MTNPHIIRFHRLLPATPPACFVGDQNPDVTRSATGIFILKYSPTKTNPVYSGPQKQPKTTFKICSKQNFFILRCLAHCSFSSLRSAGSTSTQENTNTLHCHPAALQYFIAFFFASTCSNHRQSISCSTNRTLIHDSINSNLFQKSTQIARCFRCYKIQHLYPIFFHSPSPHLRNPISKKKSSAR